MNRCLHILLAACVAVCCCFFASGTVAAQAPSQRWGEFQYDAQNNAVFAAPGWDVAWRADIHSKTNGGLSVVNNTLYVESFDHNLYAFDARSGRELWHRELPNVVMNTPIVAGGIVVVGTGTAKVLKDSPTLPIMGEPQGDAIYGLDVKTGAILWRFLTVGEDMPTGVSVVVNRRDEFVFTNGDNHIYALDLSTGKLLWSKDAPGLDGMASLTAADGIVYGISSLGNQGYFQMLSIDERLTSFWSHTWSLDPVTGSYRWIEPYGVADAGVTVGDGRAFVEGFSIADAPSALAQVAKNGWASMNTGMQFHTTLTALDQKTGRKLWSYVGGIGPNNTFGSATFTADTMYENGVLYASLAFSKQMAAFDGKTGHVRWIIPTEWPVKTSAVLDRGLLFFGDCGGYFYVVAASDGHIVHKYKFPAYPSKWGFAKTPPVIVGNTLYDSADRWVYAMRVSDLIAGTVSAAAAPPMLGPSLDWCTFDSRCTSGTRSGVQVIQGTR